MYSWGELLLRRKLFLSSMVVFVLLSFSLVVSVEASSIMWSRTYGGEYGNIVYSFDRACSLVETSNGGFALVGTRHYFGSILDSWLVKTDEYGNVEWNHTYGEGRASSLVETSDGGYALAGSGGTDFCLIKTDEYGNMEWNRTYGGTAEDHASSLVEYSDGGYVIAGYTSSFDVRACDYWLIKTDEYGIIPEFPSLIILPLLLTATLLVIIYKQKISKNTKTNRNHSY